MIKDGGNTRLAILNELWLETQDYRFYELKCMFHPWTSDFDVYVGHIIENDLRAPFSFIERAVAAVKFRSELESKEQKSLSLRDLAKKIHSLGWTKVDHVNLSFLLYAHDILFPIIPAPFWAGMGRPGVKAIRKMLDNARTFWESVANPEEGNFDEIWPSVFMPLDSEDFDITNAQNQLEAVIAEKLNAHIMSVRGEIHAIAQGVSRGGVRPSNVYNPPPNDVANVGSSSNKAGTPFKPNLKEPSARPNGADSNNIPPAATPKSGSQSEVPAPQPSAYQHATSHASHTTLDHLLSYTTQELMDNAFGLAVEYAAHFGFDTCVELASDHGFNGVDGYHSGFVLLPPSKEVRRSAFANHHFIVNYLYLFQLSNWCCADHDDPAMRLVSLHNPITWLTEETISHTYGNIMHMRALSAATQFKGATESRVYEVMVELETTVGILFGRCQEHLGQEV